jgi:Uma2 family endonuclease
LVLGASASQSQDELRWSYLIWREGIAPFLVVELLFPGTEDEDLGQTLRVIGKPPTKWQVYEQILRVNFYALYDRYSKQFRLFELRGSGYVELVIDGQGFWFEALQLGLGLWNGSYFGVEGQWLSWYDRSGWAPIENNCFRLNKR